ncbi:AAA family ATPase [Methylocucumis oryzae]|uniref:AAA family ATPase n=1 Tax=Methylocucumis oryzae TaxID=1632867 RepID=UPI0009E55066|nr:AAA family ATPase [Methylocucumis oryzae]
MTHFFNTVRITNFKSLKDVTLNDCKRINLLIGKPNVGKSNILEAIGLYGLGYSRFNKNKKLNQYVRFENSPELFFEGDIQNYITLSINNDIDEPNLRIQYLDSNLENLSDSLKLFDKSLKISIFTDSTQSFFYVDNGLNIVEEAGFSGLSNVKFYKFQSNLTLEKQNLSYLIPPFGVNLLGVIQANKELRKDLSDIFLSYGLKLVFDIVNQSLKLMKQKSEDEIFLIPYSSMADTLQRVVFYKAAIASNQNSILLFEEPEAHCFPPYIRQITQDIIDSETNQFFVATHSPYVLNDFLEYQRDDVALYMADFKNGETVVYRLTDDELDEVYNYGIDVFFNYERFTSI